jgi:serine/threonine-protein kinase
VRRWSCSTCGSIFRIGYSCCPADGGKLEELDEDPLVGKTIAARYVMEACVGEGAMGRVYRARHVRLSRRFAIKILFGDLAADPTMQVRFAREAEAASRLDHPNIVSVIDFGDHDGLLYLAMNFVAGASLAQVVLEQAPFDTARAVGLSRQLAAGLAHAHEHGLIHRDFKADNVLVIERGGREIPKIVDFGLAILPELAAANDRLTTEGLVVGTPAYMSPEQATGSQVDHRCDLYALGVLMYEMLAGQLPFEGSQAVQARHNVVSTPLPIGRRTPGVIVDPELEKVVLTLMNKDPADRFPTANDVLTALDKWADDELTPLPGSVTAARFQSSPGGDDVESAPTIMASSQVSPPVRVRSRTGWVIGIVAAVAAAIGTVFVVRGGGGGEPGDKAGASAIAPQTAPPADAAMQVASTPPADAGAVVVAAPPPDATPKAKPRKRIRNPRPKPRPKPDETVSVEKFRAAYQSVASQVDRLEREKGSDAAAPHRTKFLAIPYIDSVRVPALRKEAYGKLRRIERKVRRARKQ